MRNVSLFLTNSVSATGASPNPIDLPAIQIRGYNGFSNTLQESFNADGSIEQYHLDSRQQQPGSLTVNYSSIITDPTNWYALKLDGGAGSISGNSVSIDASSLALNAPVRTSSRTFYVTATTITQASAACLLKESWGTLDITTTGSTPLGIIDAPFNLAAPNLHISTGGSAFLNVIGNSTIATSTIRGDLTLSATKNLSTSGFGLSVSGLAIISAGANLGLSKSPFGLTGSNLSPFPTIKATLIAQKNVNVEVNGSIELINGFAGGSFKLNTQNDGSIIVDGLIQTASAQTTLKTDGVGQIILNAGSAIVSKGNVTLQAGSDGIPAFLVNSPINPNVSFSVAGTSVIQAPTNWARITVTGNNSININDASQKYRVILNPGTQANPGIKLNGASITIVKAPSENFSQDDGDSKMLPVAFQCIAPLAPHSARHLIFASIQNTKFYSCETPILVNLPEGLRFLDGRAIVVHNKRHPLFIKVGEDTIELRGKVVAELVQENSIVSVTNLADTARHSLLVKATNGSQISLAPGERLVLRQETDLTPKRNESRLEGDYGLGARLSEVSLPYLLSYNKILALLRNSDAFRKVLKTAACLEAVKSSRVNPCR